jgi:uncharacterized repeat protein (TIGR03803 family)
MRTNFRSQFHLSAAIAGVVLMVAEPLAGQNFTTLHSFNHSDGANPQAGLILSGSTLYGTARDGGGWGAGMVFSVNTDGTGFTTLHSFTLGSDGASPIAGLILSGNTLYGTAWQGGGSRLGTVFSVNTDGTSFTILHTFSGGSDGAYPCAGLILSGHALYGTTEGTVFSVNTDGTGFTTLHTFSGGSYGVSTEAGLVLSGNTLYGTAAYGGSSGNGTVFAINTDGTGFTTLHSFTALASSQSTNSDGANPYSTVILSGNTLYGTAANGGGSGLGAVFSVNTDGTGFIILHTFSGGSDGGYPLSDGLILSGNVLYGMADHGGRWGYGTVFSVNTDGTGFTTLHTFSGGSDGANPIAGLILSGNTLYGTASGGGSSGDGVVFRLAGLPIAPSITEPPLTQTAETGSVAWFFVEVTNTPPESTYHQWYFNGTNALGGATNSYIDVTNVQPVQAGAYTVVVTNLYGAVTSAPALLSVIPPVETTVVPAVVLPGGNSIVLHLEYADGLAAPSAWSSFTNVTLGSGPQLCFDLSQPLPAQRFYRAWQTTGPQPVLDLSLATEIPLTGAIGSSVQIDYINVYGPTNAWVTLATVMLTNSPQLYFDVTAFRHAPRLYRLVASP